MIFVGSEYSIVLIALRRYILILILFVIACRAEAQTGREGSAAQLNLSAASLARHDPASALRDASQALEIAGASGQSAEKAFALRNIALVRLYLLHDYRDALEHCRQALEIDLDAGNYRGAVATAIVESEIYGASGQIHQALYSLERAIRWADSLMLPMPKFEALLRSADLHQQIGNDARATEFLKQASELMGNSGDESMRAEYELAVGRRELAAGNMTLAQQLLITSAAVFARLQHHEKEACAQYELGELLVRKGFTEKAMEACLRSLQLHRDTGNIRGRSRSFIQLSKLHRLRLHYGPALDAADSALQLAERSNDNEAMFGAFIAMAEAQMGLGEMQEARICREKAARINDQMLDEMLERRIRESASRAVLSEIELELKEKEWKAELQRKETLMRGYLYFAVLLLFILSAGFTIYFRYLSQRYQQMKAQVDGVQKNLKEQGAVLFRLQRIQDRLQFFLEEGLAQPMQVLRSYSSLLTNNSELITTESSGDIGTGLDDALRNMAHFIKNLLLWTRLQTGMMRLNREEFNLTAVTEELFREFRPGADERKVNLELLAEPEVIIWADRKAFALVMRNLLSNAVRFSPSGGVVSVFADEWKDRIEVGVRDNGPGMEEEVKKRLLDPAAGHPKSVRSPRPGSGFGFAIARDFLLLHRARIAIDSRPEGGTTVRFTMQKKGMKERSRNPFKS